MAWPGGQAPQGGLSPDERQRKEEEVHSITSKTPAQTTPWAEDMRSRRKHALRVPRPSSPAGRILLFLFWTVHGPFACGLRAAASRRLASGTRLRAQSRFLLEGKPGPPRGLPRGERRKERSRAQSPPQAGTEWAEFLPTTWGGAMNQPSLVSNPPRPKGEQHSPLCKSVQ